MAIGVTVDEGAIVPLSFKILNGDGTKFLRAIVRDPSNSIIDAKDMDHVDKGIYKPLFDLLMTSDSFITVSFIIYNDAGRTVEDTTIGTDEDIFIKGTIASALGQLDGGGDLIGVMKTQLELSGIILDTTALSHNFSQDLKLSGTIKEEDDLSGTIDEEKIKGSIE